MYNSKTKILQTRHCILRPISVEDASDLFYCYSQDKVVKYLPFEAHKTINDSKHFIETFLISNPKNKNPLHYVIILKSNNKVIGNVGFNNLSEIKKQGEIGICINPSYWGRSLSTEVTDEIIRFGFYTLMLKSIIAITYNENNYSQNPLFILGFKHTKTYYKKFKYSNEKIRCNLYKLYRKQLNTES